MPRKNILLAMFDVRPVRRAASFDFSKVQPKAEFKPPTPKVQHKPPRSAVFTPTSTPTIALAREAEPPQNIPSRANPKEVILQEFERSISEPANIAVELAKVGGRLYEHFRQAPKFRRGTIKPEKYEPMQVPTPAPIPVSNIIPAKTAEVRKKTETIPSYASSPVSREIDIWLEKVKKDRFDTARSGSAPLTFLKLHWPFSFKFGGKIGPKRSSPLSGRAGRAILYLVGFALFALVVFGFARKNTIGVQNNVTFNGGSAVANLEDAKQKLENFNFLDAANSFALAYDDFNRASKTLNQFGASFVSIFGNLPGLEKLKAANNLIEAGQSLSKAGENLSLAFSTIYKTNIFSFLAPPAIQAPSRSLSKLISEFKDVLVFADKNIKKASRLLADVDASAIPEDKHQLFADFKEKIPEFQKYIGETIDYSDFLLKFIGDNGAKTYLVLLQNNSELRATGGFPGTYALVTFEKGYLKKIFVDDVYQLDAGTKENIIPPIPLQHITANWGLRDANWFADFPASARKIEEFYKLDTGGEIDGVMTITPDIITKILGITGPIDMPEYGMELDQNNFLDQLQEEVEYKANRAKPKKIVADLQPKFFDKLSKQDKNNWLEIFKIILDAVREKHILAYFNNSELEGAAVKNNFGGEIKQPAADYLQVILTNVKGSKTDYVTDSSFNLKVSTDDTGEFIHELAINRVHNGGDSKYGFYNRDNPAYIRVYVPKGSVLESIKGQSATDFKSLIDYNESGFKKDPDINSLEQSTSHPFTGVDIYEESGKTVFGFWLITKPKEKKSVVLSYKTPVETSDGRYLLLWQKQSGTAKDPVTFNFNIPDGKKVINRSEGLQTVGDMIVLDSDLSIDREIDIGFR